MWATGEGGREHCNAACFAGTICNVNAAEWSDKILDVMLTVFQSAKKKGI